MLVQNQKQEKRINQDKIKQRNKTEKQNKETRKSKTTPNGKNKQRRIKNESTAKPCSCGERLLLLNRSIKTTETRAKTKQ